MSEEDKEERHEVTPPSLAAAKETSVDAVVLSELDRIKKK